MANIKINKAEQIKAVQYVKDTSESYKTLLQQHWDKMLDVYKGYSTFVEDRKADRQTTFKVNKAHEVVNKILPRIMAKNPKWIVSLRNDEFYEEDKLLSGEDRVEKIKLYDKMTRGIQDYLTYIFDRYSQREPLRLWAKNMLIYGNSYAKVKFKYEIMTKLEDEEGKKSYKEEVVGEYPTIEVKSWTDVLYDPRYVIMEDMPAIIDLTNNVRLGQLKKQSKKYMNLDLLDKIPDASDFTRDERGYKKRIETIAGINNINITGPIDKNKLTVKDFYGWYTYNGEERLYQISTVCDIICICFKEISHIPFEDIKCFEDTETHFATGFVEPILGLQDELNFKKNSASEYINQALNRSFLWSPVSGIDPRDLVSKPGNIIVTSKDAQTAMANLVEMPMRNLPTDFFQEQNDFERQIQSMTFTVDTSNTQNQQALTNTATGIRVKFFESNSVIDEVRKHFEEGLEKLAYKLLQATYDNMEDNIVIKKIDEEGFWEINKELMRDALKRYTIKVEANSSSFDSIEQRREDAIAMYNLLLQAKQAGLNVDLEEGLRDVLNTREKKDVNKFIIKEDVTPQILGISGGMAQMPAQQASEPSQLTEAVAGGSLTTGVQ